MDHGKPVKLPSLTVAGVRALGLTQVKGQNASANTGERQPGLYVFRVPPNATGATIMFAADYNIGTFAAYYYGDHKRPDNSPFR
jgi:hypothetical protein